MPWWWRVPTRHDRCGWSTSSAPRAPSWPARSGSWPVGGPGTSAASRRPVTRCAARRWRPGGGVPPASSRRPATPARTFTSCNGPRPRPGSGPEHRAARVSGGKNARMRLLGLMISIGVVDSLNPSTIGPALYLAHADHPRRRVVEFTAAVFTVYLAGGALIALGPGQLIRSALPHAHATPRHIAEIVAGVILIVAAVIVWRSRDRIVRRGLPQARGRRSSILLGATITALELPTAFPYFAAIAAVVGAGLDPGRTFGLLLIFNVCFILPLLVIVGVLAFGGPRSERMLAV